MFGSLPVERVRILEDLAYRLHLRIISERRNADEWSYSLLCAFHQDLFGPLFPDLAGVLRTRDVSLRDYVVPRPGQIVYRLMDIVGTARELIACATSMSDVAEKMVYVMEHGARLHASCVLVQPFIDGNKRWALHVLNAMLIDCGFWPGTLIDLFGVEARARYLSAIDRAVAGDPDPLAELILKGWLSSRDVYRR